VPSLTKASPQPPAVIKLLAHDLRWNLLKTLTTSDQRVQELAVLAHEPMNLVSYHLKKLRNAGIVTTRHSEADGRDIYYSLDLPRLRDLYQAAGMALHPALHPARCEEPPRAALTSLPARKVLFVCTHNSARSQMAEGLLRHFGGAQLEVASAGSHPTSISLDALRAMDTLGIDIRGQRSKHLKWFEGQAFDYVITVCDRAREICPTFPGDGQQLHWGFADPTVIEDAVERQHIFEQIAHQLATRIEFFLTTLAESA
jgi:ArsR family transcriptional regulator, arsenate/arsenite/antimonite-responsive transcriptional repressor / arsenate reductase (thioredoxin)